MIEIKKEQNKHAKDEIVFKKEKKSYTKIEKATYGLIYSMIIDNKNINKYEDSNIVLIDDTSRYLASEIAYYYKKYGCISVADFYTYLEDKRDLLDLYNKIINYDDINLIDDNVVNDYILVIKAYNKSQEIKRLEKLIKETLDDIEKSKIAEQIRLLKLKE